MPENSAARACIDHKALPQFSAVAWLQPRISDLQARDDAGHNGRGAAPAEPRMSSPYRTDPEIWLPRTSKAFLILFGRKIRRPFVESGAPAR
jgi:hypothetical protein